MNTFPLLSRQVHLDFHTSEYIPDVGADFDATEFAQTFKEAHVNSVTIFAKCHHGMCYYPTKAGVQHPALNGRDLLGEMIEALHRENIRCPIYTTLAWEEDIARRFPQWRQMKKDGRFANRETLVDRTTVAPGLWKFNNWIHPEFMDYTEAHLKEVLEGYDVDGIFFDIFTFHAEGGWSEASIAFREKHGLMHNDSETHNQFIAKAQQHFASRFTSLVQSYHSDASVFYNANYDLSTDARSGTRCLSPYITHFELESLPSGFWGYHHFPRQARGVIHLSKPWIGMTGRFQKMWGDFGGIKPQAALEYECFRSQALGGGNSIGDQLPPRGKLEPAAYRLIGNVYKQCEQAESFYKDSEPVFQVGVITAQSTATKDSHTAQLSDEGTLLMLAEMHYEAALIDENTDFNLFQLIILPDEVLVTGSFSAKLQAFKESGGKVLLSYLSGLDSNNVWSLNWIGVKPGEAVTTYPTYWRARENFLKTDSDSDFVIYSQGMVPDCGSEEWNVLVDRKLPYFKRNDLQYCSHFQTPPQPGIEPDGAVIERNGIVWFGDPVFREYRKTGNKACFDVVKKVIERLIGKPAIGGDLPSTAQIFLRRKNQNLLVTLLHYIPQRKALDIDIIDTAHSFGGYSIQLQKPATVIQHSGDSKQLCKDTIDCPLPPERGRLLLELPDFFPVAN